MWVFYLISLPLTLGMVVLTLKYFAGPGIPRYVFFTVGYAWFCSLSIIIIVPADIWTVIILIGTCQLWIGWDLKQIYRVLNGFDLISCELGFHNWLNWICGCRIWICLFKHWNICCIDWIDFSNAIGSCICWTGNNWTSERSYFLLLELVILEYLFTYLVCHGRTYIPAAFCIFDSCMHIV